ncbi:hypothetical protein GCK72_005000 [Caenorhabditis remanei]|uniref:NADH-rubredoxin oxidoreductase C-terminal domain-containing protein n=1 Tax=Caenorhabditis remanei TaxID=31234 RepID=A0A6A5HDE1_CAERE|nr:hypothetical protein GCK72_005000 [Caenorhabditis remanei]KAF1765049.1 hypothetical protein GCK72_005000 [Caenorhabditis remanei]
MFPWFSWHRLRQPLASPESPPAPLRNQEVVFLGDYKPERQRADNWKVVLRDTEEDKLVRCVVVNNVIVGALLIGETEMEETLENLILNKTDLEGISETFLEPGVDLDDYFD